MNKVKGRAARLARMAFLRAKAKLAALWAKSKAVAMSLITKAYFRAVGPVSVLQEGPVDVGVSV